MGFKPTASTSAKRKVIFLFVIYFAVTLAATIWLHSIVAWPPGKALLPAFWTEINLGGLVAGLWASFVFGLFVGLATFAFSLRQPEEDKIEQRMLYLFNGSGGSNEWLSYSRQMTGKLAAYGSGGSFKYFVSEYDPRVKAFKLQVSNSFTLQNMFADTPYIDEAVHVSIQPDAVDHPTIGGITLLEAMDEERKWVKFIDAPVDIARAAGSYSKDIRLGIAPNARSEYRFECWGWCCVDVPWQEGVNRYSENLGITLKNQLKDMTVEVEFKTRDGKNGTVQSKVLQLRPEEEVNLASQHRMTPNCLYFLTFHEPHVAK